ncbi:MAG TPA: patatin-like phospholipase family protein, partial [Candidatus Baltobacteraceae bacterium]|nr:patatin-like phospholipase family protein [Candidatus Baltobacteraceae bacterium]
MQRGSFIATAASASLLATLPIDAPAQTARTGRKALVLIGGANRGAYEAGVIQALIENQHISDGQPLDYDMIAGTSIGALNAFLVATAQYTQLRELWQGGISGGNVFRLKHRYESIPDPQSGVVTRAGSALKLGKGLVTNVTGVLDPEPVRAMLGRYVKADTPMHLPLYISTTNLTRQRNQMFSRKATTIEGVRKQQINDQLLAPYAQISRPATDAMLQDVMFATACLPMMFDPIVIMSDDGSPVPEQYVDGGVTSNVPIGIAQLCVESLHVVLLFPKLNPNVTYGSAAEIGLGVFNTMQARIIEYQVRLVYEAGTRDLPFHPFIIRPESEL